MGSGEKSTFGWKTFIISCLIGGGIAVAITLLILVGVAALALSGKLNAPSSVIAVDVSAAIGALVGGLIAAKRSGAGALPCGAATAVTQLIICMLVGLIFYESFMPANGGAALAASVFAGALVGALLGTRRGGHKTRRKK